MNLKLQVVFNILSKFSLQLNIFVLSIVLVRFLDQSDYGTYLQFQLCVNTGIYMFTLGVPHSIYYFFSKVKSKRVYMLSCVGVMMFTGIVVASILNYGDYLGDILNNPDLNNFALLIGVAVIVLLPYELAEPFLISAKKSNLFSVVNAVAGLAFFVIVLICLYLEVDLGTIFTSIVTLYVTQFLLLFVLIVLYSRDHEGEGERKRSPVPFKQVVKYCVPVSMSVMIGRMGAYFDRFIISINFDPAQFAVYSRGATHLPIVDIFAYSVNNVLFPKYVECHDAGKTDELFRLWRKGITKIALLIYPLLAFFWVYAEDFIIILYTDQYADSVPVFQVYLIALLAKLAIFDTMMRVSGNTRYMPYIAATSLAINLPLSLILLNYFGIVGPAIATIVTIFVTLFLCLEVTRRIYSVTWSHIMPWLDLGKIFMVSFLAVLPLYLLKGYRVNLFEMGFSFALFVLLAAGLVVVFKLATVDEIKDQFVAPVLNKIKRR